MVFATSNCVSSDLPPAIYLAFQRNSVSPTGWHEQVLVQILDNHAIAIRVNEMRVNVVLLICEQLVGYHAERGCPLNKTELRDSYRLDCQIEDGLPNSCLFLHQFPVDHPRSADGRDGWLERIVTAVRKVISVTSKPLASHTPPAARHLWPCRQRPREWPISRASVARKCSSIQLSKQSGKGFPLS